MNTPHRKVNPFDPTDEATADQSTESAGGLTGGRTTPPIDDIVARDRASRGDTRRQYDEELEEGEPSDSPTVKSTMP